jgi:hypothetical protein
MATEDDAKRLVVANADVLKALLDDDKRNYSAWKVVDQVGNRFNRMLLFRGVRYHQSAEYFGTTLEKETLSNILLWFGCFCFVVSPAHFELQIRTVRC